MFKGQLADKESFASKLSLLIYGATRQVFEGRKLEPEDVVIEHPVEPQHGDYAANIALSLFSKRPKMITAKSEIMTPFDLANQIVNVWRSKGLPDFVAKVEVAQPGFINIWLQNEALIRQAQRVLKENSEYGASDCLKGKKYLLEHTSPNPQTTIMLGHLRNNFLGMTSSRFLEFAGAKVVKDCIVNDRGVHICRSIWGYLVFAHKKSGLKKSELKNFKKIRDSQLKKLIAQAEWKGLLKAWLKKKTDWWEPKNLNLKPDHTNLIWYVLGSRAYNLFPEVRTQVEEILLTWEKEAEAVRAIWRQILRWSDKGYSETYKRVGSAHDWFWYESDHYKEGKQIVDKGLKKGAFRHSEGAIVTNLKKYNLPDTVVVKADGTALYITQDLALTKLKMKKFPSNWYIWDIGEEQTLYFKQLFAICEQLGIGKGENFFHLSYALINFKGGGKMATRKGDVVMADEVLDDLKARALRIIKASNQELRGKMTAKELSTLAEKVAVGSLKYSLLKFSRETTIYFDPEESLSLEGNAGPYLQYTYARTQSVLKKAKELEIDLAQLEDFEPKDGVLKAEEASLLRLFYQFPEIILRAMENFAPNLLCNYLFDLAQRYNLFYNRWSILQAENEDFKKLRLLLTAATAQLIKNGLTLLGIEAPTRM